MKTASTSGSLLRSLALLAALALTGCSHETRKPASLDTKLAQETDVSNTNDLNLEVGAVIRDAPNLTEAQRARLVELHRGLRTQMDSLRKTALQLRSLLVKDLVAANYDADEVRQIENRLRANDNDRTNVLLDTIEKANEILGRTSTYHERITRALFNEAHQGRPD